MQVQMFFPLETLFTHATNMRPLRAMTELMSLQMLLSLQTCAADIANVPSL